MTVKGHLHKIDGETLTICNGPNGRAATKVRVGEDSRSS